MGIYWVYRYIPFWGAPWGVKQLGALHPKDTSIFLMNADQGSSSRAARRWVCNSTGESVPSFCFPLSCWVVLSPVFFPLCLFVRSVFFCVSCVCSHLVVGSIPPFSVRYPMISCSFGSVFAFECLFWRLDSIHDSWTLLTLTNLIGVCNLGTPCDKVHFVAFLFSIFSEVVTATTHLNHAKIYPNTDLPSLKLT